ncbi:hypothetical protein KUW09_11990 [Mameliella alba]|nr:hypothetical protein [Mameliella alba]MCA0956490.1 6-bladed beta-propeller [Mameliella alba]
MEPGRPTGYVALGHQRYRVAHIMDPALTGITDVAVRGDRILALRRNAPELVLLDLDGRLTGETAGLGDFVCGHGLRLLNDGHLAATDMDGHKIAFLDNGLQITGQLHCDELPRLGRPFNHPCDCTQGPDGRLYVADGYGNSCVHIFGPDRTYIRSFGNPGDGAGAFSTPHSLLFDTGGRLCVADRENNRVQRFDAEGTYIDEIGGLHKPMALALGEQGNLLVTDQTPRLSAYDADGILVGRCRTFSTYGHGIAVAPDGTIVIADMDPDRVTLLVPDQAPVIRP